MKKISDDRLKNVCKIGQGKECCRYILAGAKGIECAKGTAWQAIIDDRVSQMTAQGDNCKGEI